MKFQREIFPHLAGPNSGLWGRADQYWQNQLSTPRLYRLAIALAIVFLCSCAYVLFTETTSENLNCLSNKFKGFNIPPASSPSPTLPQDPHSNFTLDTPSLIFSRGNYDRNSTTTSLHNIVFGIGAAAKTWNSRQRYMKQWWRPKEMRGFVWLDEPVANCSDSLPPCKISADTSQFTYTNVRGPRSAVRIARIVTETFRLGLPDVHWFVMGDDDTFFVAENLVKVLSKYDHNLFYYIGSSSESHQQNLEFSYNMAFGGGGFAISYPLAKALESMQDDCLQRYPSLYGSDERIQACLAELGVPLTKEPGFHQFDIHGDAFGFLSAHPLTPFISMHHLDKIYPLFPKMNQERALQHLSKAIKVEPGGIFQQSICYEKTRNISISVSWGYVVQIVGGILPAREFEIPTRTFSTWRKSKSAGSYTFTTRPYPENSCQKPLRYYLASTGNAKNEHLSNNYLREVPGADCSWMKPVFQHLQWIRVVKERLDENWLQGPRRQCCQVSDFGKSFMEIRVKNCKEGTSI
ncbi:hypothetical protein O6H91_16G075600 [Diphasiastrum complanatum]|uniref:Uncharacterized protein n=1 Tax=Diphasiastrum complanatum TaxID=34168 RepID=A0ACC2BDM9_DIPCM|nr:hypothetical protein O6H91_16G075600 [Diphasiastrum complanatum]